MIKLFRNWFSLNLQLFGEGAGGDGGTGAEAGATTGVDAGGPGLQRGSKNPLAGVQYGIQDAPVSADANNGRDLSAEFEDLIKGDYKEEYDRRMSDTVQKRLKSTKETVAKYEALTPTLELLAQKYGISDATDIEALNAAIAEDDAYYEDEALEKGVTVEQLKEIKKMERENAELKKAMDERNAREQIDRDVANWMEQEKAARQVFPNLDLKTELQNPQFLGLLKSGVDVQTAYFAVHNRELVPQAMQYASKQTEQKVVNKVMSNSRRPAENGMNSQSSAIVKNDVSQLSKADRQEIIRRVAAGEKIRF